MNGDDARPSDPPTRDTTHDATREMAGYGNSTYGDAFADVYDDWYAQISDVDATVACLTALVEEIGGGSVLELAVGTGRLAIPLAGTGVEVHGIDTSQAMLDRLRAKPGGEAVHTVLGDMALGDGASGLPGGPHATVFVAYNSLFALDAPARAACFDAVARALVPGGHFVIEAFVPDVDRPAGATIGVRSMSATHVVLSIDVHHPDDRRAEGQFVEITEAGGVRLRPWSVHYASPADLDADAAHAGFVLADRWEDWAGAPFDQHSGRHVSVYRLDPAVP
jgi:SAM-dependent methyltransferase